MNFFTEVLSAYEILLNQASNMDEAIPPDVYEETGCFKLIYQRRSQNDMSSSGGYNEI